MKNKTNNSQLTVELQEQKAQLIDDLLATVTVMEELWRYHPDNPNKKDIIEEYNILKKIQSSIEDELKEISESE